MITFIVLSFVFLAVVVWVLRSQNANRQLLQEQAAALNRAVDNVVPIVQKQHTVRFGRASTALEDSFPGKHRPSKKTANGTT